MHHYNDYVNMPSLGPLEATCNVNWHNYNVISRVLHDCKHWICGGLAKQAAGFLQITASQYVQYATHLQHVCRCCFSLIVLKKLL